MARRRPISGNPLLIAGAGLFLGVGCSGAVVSAPEQPVGNLMAPPQITAEICVDAVPADAKVVVNAVAASARCTPVTNWEGSDVTVEVSAPGYETRVEHVNLAQALPPIKVELGPVAPPNIPPIGNLMPPPPPPPPVGNLMPPPQIPPEPPK
jgi:hypothetical protein